MCSTHLITRIRSTFAITVRYSKVFAPIPYNFRIGHCKWKVKKYNALLQVLHRFKTDKVRLFDTHLRNTDLTRMPNEYVVHVSSSLFYVDTKHTCSTNMIVSFKPVTSVHEESSIRSCYEVSMKNIVFVLPDNHGITFIAPRHYFLP